MLHILAQHFNAGEKCEVLTNLRGYILIDVNGQIIEVLQEESEKTFSKKKQGF